MAGEDIPGSVLNPNGYAILRPGIEINVTEIPANTNGMFQQNTDDSTLKVLTISESPNTFFGVIVIGSDFGCLVNKNKLDDYVSVMNIP